MVCHCAFASAIMGGPMTVMAAGATVMFVSSLPYMTNGKVTHEDIKKTLSSFRDFFSGKKEDDERKGGDGKNQGCGGNENNCGEDTKEGGEDKKRD